jgi:hypothetical protein
MRTYRGSVARHLAYGKTHEQIRGSLMFRHHMLGLHHTDAAGR